MGVTEAVRGEALGDREPAGIGAIGGAPPSCRNAVHNRAGEPLTVRPHDARPNRTQWVGGPVTNTFEGVLA